MNKEVNFERQALYDEVWSTPLTKLGVKYSMSDNGIRKVCKAMNIPLPSVGHWAKVAAGHSVERIALPRVSSREVFQSHPPVPINRQYQEPADAEWLREKLAFEAQPGNLIAVDPDPHRWHPALRPTRDFLANAVKEREKMIKERDRYHKEREAAEKRRIKQAWAPNLNFVSWVRLDDGGLLVDRHKTNGFRVSTLTMPRALAVANALMFAAEARSCLVTIEEPAGRIRLQLEGAWLSIAIRERQEVETVKRTSSYGLSETVKVNRPRDELALVADCSPSGTLELRDREDNRIEGRLNEVFTRLYAKVVAGREQGREDRARLHRQAIQRAAYEEVTRQRALEMKVKAAEESRQKTLLDESSSWHQAEQVRGYVAHVRSSATPDQQSEVDHWCTWALEYADGIDPTVKRLRALRANQ